MTNIKDKKTCFIITPIGNVGSTIRRKTDGIIEEVIEPILNELNYEVVVSHRIDESGSVTNAIIRGVYESDLVIANLTGNNPNVMYEVALRHASAKPIIHISEKVSELPFDINDQRTIEYTDDMAGACQLKDDLRKKIQSIKYDEMVENPITAALAKKNLVNIPKEDFVDIADLLTNMQDEMQSIRREMSSLKTKKSAKKSETIEGKEMSFENLFALSDLFNEVQK